jgi:hypothetical protein
MANQREGKRRNSTQSWIENTYMTLTVSFSSLQTLINVSLSPFTVTFVWMPTFCIGVYIVN